MLIIIIMLAPIANGITLKTAEAMPDVKKVPDNYPSIQAAIDAANAGDTIIVANGIYNETLFIEKSISLIGENPVTTIIDGGRRGHVINVISSNVVISGFTIQNGTRELYPYGGISLYNCGFAMIYNNIIKGNYYGLHLSKSNNNRIFNNVIMNNSYAGVYIHESSSGNIFFENTIASNFIGVLSLNSPQNIFYHNNFIENINQTRPLPPMTFDNGAEGNFWSDYYGVDENLDGIGDSTYVYAGDRYPLMGKFVNFTFQYEEQTYFLSIISNSTISNFYFDNINSKIHFDVVGQNNTIGFCRIAMPSITIKNYTVYIDDKAPSYIRNWTDLAYLYGYFSYPHTDMSQIVTVILDLPKNEQPELWIPIVVVMILIIAITTMIILMKRRRKPK